MAIELTAAELEVIVSALHYVVGESTADDNARDEAAIALRLEMREPASRYELRPIKNP